MSMCVHVCMGTYVQNNTNIHFFFLSIFKKQQCINVHWNRTKAHTDCSQSAAPITSKPLNFFPVATAEEENEREEEG